ncbi:MAG: cyclophilin family peptidyl-prolyl cis-trans isomerase [Bdellovibrionota bacterium]|jgi:cyclophilin family peptidyl-prolyl cis-trans isomerase
MRQLINFALFALVLTVFAACGNNGMGVTLEIKTNKGDITVLLFDETPKHKENFIKLANENYYEGTLFHRVISDFMIQGGDPNSKGSAPNASLGSGGPGYLIDAEIGQPHLRGALSAARTNNPQKASSGSQFYIVTGVKQSEATMTQFETMKGVKYSEAQRKAYMENGGRPDLDMEYTVFGQVLTGMDVVDIIANVPKGRGDRPTEDIVIESVTVQ